MTITNAKIMTMEGETIENGFILIEDKKIKAVGSMSELAKKSEPVLDAAGKLVLPGFIDPHCHIGICGDGIGFEGDDANEETESVTPQLRAIDAVNSFDNCFLEAMSAGITTVLTGPGSANPIAGKWCAMKTKRDRIDNVLLSSCIGMKFSLGENPKTTYNSKSQMPVTRMAIASLIREQLYKAKRYMEDMEDAYEDDNDPPEYDAKCEALVPVIKREKKAFFHVHRADDIFTAIRIAEEFNLDYVLVHATEGHLIADMLADIKPNIIVGPIICDRSKPELKNQTVKNAAVLFEHGISAAICTDHPENPIQYLALSAAICEKSGLPFQAALEAITITAARISGLDSRVGSIKAGKDADIVIFAENPLGIAEYPTHVIINGELLKGEC